MQDQKLPDPTMYGVETIFEGLFDAFELIMEQYPPTPEGESRVSDDLDDLKNPSKKIPLFFVEAMHTIIEAIHLADVHHAELAKNMTYFVMSAVSDFTRDNMVEISQAVNRSRTGMTPPEDDPKSP